MLKNPRNTRILKSKCIYSYYKVIHVHLAENAKIGLIKEKKSPVFIQSEMTMIDIVISFKFLAGFFSPNYDEIVYKILYHI